MTKHNSTDVLPQSGGRDATNSGRDVTKKPRKARMSHNRED